MTPGRAWTDVWAVHPGGTEPRQAMLEDVVAQGPFAFSADGQWLLFSSPRGGNFDVYRVPLNAEGEEALKVRSAETEPSPALRARAAIQPTPVAAAPGTQVAPGAQAVPGAQSEAEAAPQSTVPALLLAAGGSRRSGW